MRVTIQSFKFSAWQTPTTKSFKTCKCETINLNLCIGFELEYGVANINPKAHLLIKASHCHFQNISHLGAKWKWERERERRSEIDSTQKSESSVWDLNYLYIANGCVSSMLCIECVSLYMCKELSERVVNHQLVTGKVFDTRVFET